jgi:C-terminal processing protease CtpA/Prc
MPAKFNFFMRTLALSVFSVGVSAQEAPTLKEAVRDQYIDVVEDEALKKLDGNTPLFELDGYSHFLSEKELVDVSASADSEAFVQRINAVALYLRIPVFHVKTATQVHSSLLMALNNKDIKTIVIDLRGNRGGLLNAAIEVADEFIANGELASTKGRQDSSNLVFLAKPGGLAEGKRVAVLIDNRTASAAELLAGILRVNANAVLIGQRSFGKSAVQTHIQLKNGEALSLTTATYYFSDGSVLSHLGLIPAIKISNWALNRHPPLVEISLDSTPGSNDSFLQRMVNALDSN